jgi:hypothetical protein
MSSNTVCVYLGAAIDHSTATHDPFEFMTNVVKETFENCIVYNPRAAFSVTKSAMKSPDLGACEFVEMANMAALSQATVALFEIGDSFSYGLVKEILYCLERGTPFVVYFYNGKRPGFMMELDLKRSQSKFVISPGPSVNEITQSLLEALTR